MSSHTRSTVSSVKDLHKDRSGHNVHRLIGPAWGKSDVQEELLSVAQPCLALTAKLTVAMQEDGLVGLVVRCPPRERKIPGSNPACDGIFSGSSHTSDLKIGTPGATLPGAWRYRVSTGTGWPGVNIL